jgi:hypothetical protein
MIIGPKYLKEREGVDGRMRSEWILGRLDGEGACGVVSVGSG